MSYDDANATRNNLRHRGFHAHNHYYDAAGARVHYGMTSQRLKATTTDLAAANRMAANFRKHGLYSWVVWRH